ncbi:response regulator [Deinococcus hopiensis]|uniref:Response regulator containing a CheY-like receiver domain and an HTH DNA-binding domain n=1 Tax=Deinococcus hopiensis KR-140 TaxID=695939 RepID=A0A1W1UTX5_9DEIO|nr:response regulator [Deinococcus hopiensis]SMB84598.1 Response regulator containing a CheY-like receiver domain and an HTH DNA-binding domain [Deinococcus hopiensis KR-140]
MTRLFRVAIIDDSLPDLLLAQEAFEGLEHPVFVQTYSSSSTAVKALQRAGATLPDVILLDINMPTMNGFDVLKVLKADGRLSLIPVVMLTTSNEERDVHQAYSLFANSYVVKSPSFGTFVEQVETFVVFWRSSRLVNWPERLLPPKP